MVLLANCLESTSAHLTLQTAPVGEDTTAIRCLDWDRSRFDVEFELQNGTTYNSFLIEGDKTALVDTSHTKFRSLYLEMLSGSIDPNQLDYLIVSHTEPDHTADFRIIQYGLVSNTLRLLDFKF